MNTCTLYNCIEDRDIVNFVSEHDLQQTICMVNGPMINKLVANVFSPSRNVNICMVYVLIIAIDRELPPVPQNEETDNSSSCHTNS